jgi:hypothetical protein
MGFTANANPFHDEMYKLSSYPCQNYTVEKLHTSEKSRKRRIEYPARGGKILHHGRVDLSSSPLPLSCFTLPRQCFTTAPIVDPPVKKSNHD